MHCMIAASREMSDEPYIFQKDAVYLPENGIVNMGNNIPIRYEKDNTLRIIWVGAICYRKGLVLLLDALKQVKSKNWQLDICGNGELLDKLKNKAKYYDIDTRINWHGSLSREEVFKLFQKAHLHVISSLGEATTTVLFEAMSYGVPTMTLDHCGMAGVVCEKCGIKIPIHSYKQVISDMAKHIDDLIENPGKIQLLSQGVLECSKKYMWENRVKVFNEVYKEVALKYQTSFLLK